MSLTFVDHAARVICQACGYQWIVLVKVALTPAEIWPSSASLKRPCPHCGVDPVEVTIKRTPRKVR